MATKKPTGPKRAIAPEAGNIPKAVTTPPDKRAKKSQKAAESRETSGTPALDSKDRHASVPPASSEGSFQDQTVKVAPKSRSFDAPEEPDWHRMISIAAYYRAESRGFAAGSTLDDWLFAEAQIRSSMDK